MGGGDCCSESVDLVLDLLSNSYLSGVVHTRMEVHRMDSEINGLVE